MKTVLQKISSTLFPRVKNTNFPWPFPNENELVATWNYASRPYSVGDSLSFCLELALVAHQQQLTSIQLYIIVNPQAPSPPHQPTISPNNYAQTLYEMVPLFTLCPTPIQIHLIQDRITYEQFLVSCQYQRRFCYPAVNQYFYELDHPKPYMSQFSLMTLFFEQYGFVPLFDMNSQVAYSAIQQLRQQQQHLVVVHLRQRRLDTQMATGVATDRDAQLDPWLGFFKQAAKQFPQTHFVLIGRLTEIDRTFYALDNVTISKQQGWTLIDECHLILLADLFMGSNSGPATVAMFSTIPYLIFQSSTSAPVAALSWGITQGKSQLPFSHWQQQIIWTSPSEQQLMTLFSDYQK